MPRIVAACIMLAAAILLGGGGSGEPRTEAILQVLFAVTLASLALWGRPADPAPALPRMAWSVAGLVLLVPVVQLLPLPPQIWHGLPGRTTAQEALALVDAATAWMPISLTPSRTLGSLLAMIAPVAFFLLVVGLETRWRQVLLLVVVFGAALSALLGTIQVAAGESGSWRLYPQTHLLFATGFFANRNAAADFLLIGLLALAAWWAGAERDRAGPGAWLLVLALAGILALCLILTGSRMGIALLLPTAMLALIIVWPKGLGSKRRNLALAAMVGLAGLGALLALRIPALQPVVVRFLRDGDERWKLWEDTAYAIGQYWPAGSGIGSFQPIFIASEQLEFVDPSFPVRAHNDWMEFTLEAGLAGWLVLGVLAMLLGWQAWRAYRLAKSSMPGAAAIRAQLLFGLGSLGIIATHSVVDYPLRTMTLACLCALAAAMLYPRPVLAGSQPTSPLR